MPDVSTKWMFPVLVSLAETSWLATATRFVPLSVSISAGAGEEK